MLSVQHFIAHLKSTFPGYENKKILLAVSGGADSMCMLHLWMQCIDSSMYAVAHCNFGLRGEESNEEEKFVHSFCEEHNIPFFIKRFSQEDFKGSAKEGVQEAARSLRYTWFRELASAHGFNLIATAHHADDNAETVLLNMNRGKGLRSLQGIPESNGDLIRPLLPFTRSEIIACLKLHGISYRTDSSNLTGKYARNNLRLNIIPALQENNPGIVSQLNDLSRASKAALDIIRNKASAILSESAVQRDGMTILRSESWIGDTDAIPVLYEIIRPLGFNHADTAAVFRCLSTKASGKHFSGNTHILHADRGRLIITEYRAGPWNAHFTITSLPSRITHHGSLYTIAVTDRAAHSSFEKDVIYLDHDKIDLQNLALRTWMNGDMIIPLGMKQQKKLSDVFTDKKLSIPEKRNALIVESNGTIAAVAPFLTGELFRIDEDTRKILTITFSQ